MNIQLGEIAFAVASSARLSNAWNTDYGARRRFLEWLANQESLHHMLDNIVRDTFINIWHRSIFYSELL